MGSGNAISCIEVSNCGDLEADQIGLGNVEVVFFVPQPTKNIALARRKERRAVRFSRRLIVELWFLVEFIRNTVISVSS